MAAANPRPKKRTKVNTKEKGSALKADQPKQSAVDLSATNAVSGKSGRLVSPTTMPLTPLGMESHEDVLSWLLLDHENTSATVANALNHRNPSPVASMARTNSATTNSQSGDESSSGSTSSSAEDPVVGARQDTKESVTSKAKSSPQILPNSTTASIATTAGFTAAGKATLLPNGMPNVQNGYMNPGNGFLRPFIPGMMPNFPFNPAAVQAAMQDVNGNSMSNVAMSNSAPKTSVQASNTSSSDKSTKDKSTSANKPDSPNTMKKRRQQQLAKNRKSARECRRRKKEELSELRERVKELEKANLELRLQMKDIQNEKTREREEKRVITERLNTMLTDGVGDDEFSDVVSNFADLHADYGRDRRIALDFHIERVKKLMVPTQVTKMALWSLQQDDDFYKEGGDGDSGDDDDENEYSESLWKIVTAELQMTADQKKKLLQFRPMFKELGSDIEKCGKSVEEMSQLMKKKNQNIEKAIAKLTTIITPTQAARFIQWVTNNQACIHMLNKLWQV